MKKSKMFIDVIRYGNANFVKELGYVGMASSVGITQGLKYNGSFKRGITTGLITYGVLYSVYTATAIMQNYEYIMNNDGFNKETGRFWKIKEG